MSDVHGHRKRSHMDLVGRRKEKGQEVDERYENGLQDLRGAWHWPICLRKQGDGGL